MNTSIDKQMKFRYFKAGFSLIELMIVVAIIAILTAIAYPSYTSYIVKTRRHAATACLSEFSNYMERYYTTNMAYDTSSTTPTVANSVPTLDCATASQTGNYYGYAFGVAPSSTAYTVTATPIAGTPQVKDTCGKLTINQLGTRGEASGDASCW